MGPTKTIMSVHVSNYQWHEFFPRGSLHDWAGVTLISHWKSLCMKYWYRHGIRFINFLRACDMQLGVTLVLSLRSGPLLCLYEWSIIFSLWFFLVNNILFLSWGSAYIAVLLSLRKQPFSSFFPSRFISWIPRSGMQYTLLFLEVYMVHFVALER